MAAAVTACGPVIVGAPVSRNIPPGIGFPDLSNFPLVDSHAYFYDRTWGHGIQFSAANGIACYTEDSATRTDLLCQGPRPDRGPGDWRVGVSTRPAAATVGPVGRVKRLPYVEYSDEQAPLLPPHHKLFYAGFLCGVDDDGTLACSIKNHGFVLTATTTTLF
jgi:hypothetical protein